MTEPSIERYFAVLGLASTASEEEVKEARNFVTKAFHPDKYLAGSKDQLKAHQKQIEINEAYERLIKWFAAKKNSPTSAPPSKTGKALDGRPIEATILGGKIFLTLAISGGWIKAINDYFAKRPPEPYADWFVLALTLCTLALAWFLFAPESHALASRWASGKDSSQSKGKQGRN